MIPIWCRFSLRLMYVEVVWELTSKQSGVKCSEHTTELLVGVHLPLLRCTKVTITTFCTHDRLYRYKRLPFGISASEVFQNVIQQTLQGLHGVCNIVNDIIVWGTTQAEHDTNLEAVFKCLDENGLTLNGEKCDYNQPSLWFYGYVLAQES